VSEFRNVGARLARECGGTSNDCDGMDAQITGVKLSVCSKLSVPAPHSRDEPLTTYPSRLEFSSYPHTSCLGVLCVPGSHSALFTPAPGVSGHPHPNAPSLFTSLYFATLGTPTQSTPTLLLHTPLLLQVTPPTDTLFHTLPLLCPSCAGSQKCVCEPDRCPPSHPSAYPLDYFYKCAENFTQKVYF
jgi:hypothetical protein